MKHLKKFSTDTDRIAYESSNDYIEPYVSLVSENSSSHYNTFFCKLTLNDESIVKITGSGELTRTMISSYKSTCIKVEIGKLCTRIGELAFYMWQNLLSVTIPNSVTSIGNNVFQGCTGLTSITIPNSVTIIGISLVAGCTSLTSVTIGNSVTSIGNNVFQGCSGLTSIKVESGNTTYDSRNNCNALIETASNTLIAGCKNTVIPNSVTSIGNYAFEGCSSLTSMTIPNSVTSIGDSAFFDCSGLTSITIPNSVTSIGDQAFQYCSGLTSVKIPNSVTTIGESAFFGCSSLTSVIILSSVTSIGDQAFQYCNDLKTVICEGYVENIGVNAFYQTVSESQLETVEFRGGIGTFTGRSVFWGCVNLKTIKYNSNTLPTYNIASTDTPWGSTTATNTCGYTNRTAGTNIFYCPSTSTYTEAEIDPYNNGSLFSTEYGGFTISRTL